MPGKHDKELTSRPEQEPKLDDSDETGSTTTPSPRRYDVDWLRVLAMGLLIVYHIVLSFQPWASWIGFPQNDTLLLEVWPAMAMVNVWRIPLLFLVSGMGVRFAMERRDWKALLKDRSIRILMPWVFGTFGLGALFGVLMQLIGWDAEYKLQFGHLWFLLNIYCYVLWLLSTFAYLKANPDNAFFRFLSKMVARPLGVFLLALPVVVESAAVNPEHFSLYPGTLHGWLIGLVCFFLGFVIVSTQEAFWPAVEKHRWIAFAVALALFLVRLLVFKLENGVNALNGLECACWMLAILGFGSRHLNRPSRTLKYLSVAVYPVYIVHMPVQFAVCYHVLPLALSAYAKLGLVLLGTFGISLLLLHECILRRLKWIRPLFGMKLNQT